MRSSASSLLAAGLSPQFLESVHPVLPETVSVRSAPWILRRLWGPKTKAMTLGSNVFVEPATLSAAGPGLDGLLRHELVHVRQWQEEGPVRFLLGYGRQYLIARINGASHDDAYHAIDHEVEARRLSRL